MALSTRLIRVLVTLVRLDMAAGIVVAAALLVFMAWR
jgi:hypothetical protein